MKDEDACQAIDTWLTDAKSKHGFLFVQRFVNSFKSNVVQENTAVQDFRSKMISEVRRMENLVCSALKAVVIAKSQALAFYPAIPEAAMSSQAAQGKTNTDLSKNIGISKKGRIAHTCIELDRLK